MKLKFCGAARTVTGSKHLITTDKGKKILLDCGLFQGRGSETDSINRTFPFDPKEIDVLILSHAHIDHSGNIPGLVKQGFRGIIYCTPATYDLCEIMLADSAHIHENDLEYINERLRDKHKPEIEPLYSMDDVVQCLKLFVQVPYKKKFVIDEESSFMYTDSGHILGSAAISLTSMSKGKPIHVFFSGDIGRASDKILKAPDKFPQADYILCESTYGDRTHEPMTNTENRLLEIVVKTCVEKKGKLIIPAFSLGRTQELVYALQRIEAKNQLPKIKIYVDSPLSLNATDIMRKHPECFNKDILDYMKKDADPFGFGQLRYVRTAEESKSLNKMKEPCIIISASGMAEAGRIKHHLKNSIKDKKNTILIAGFCAEGTLGARLAAGEKEVRIFGNNYEVKAQVEVITSYSAHADFTEMIDYLSCQDKSKVKKVFLVHGEYGTQQNWQYKLQKEGYSDVSIPEMGQEVELV